MQGVSWLMRRAIAIASVTMTINQYTKDDQMHFDCTMVATGGITTVEDRILDWEMRDATDKVFGEVKGKSRWVRLADVDDDDYLKTGYDDLEGEHVQSWTQSKKGDWTTNQVDTCMHQYYYTNNHVQWNKTILTMVPAVELVRSRRPELGKFEQSRHLKTWLVITKDDQSDLPSSSEMHNVEEDDNLSADTHATDEGSPVRQL
ncbi:MAG: hypothetical protein Q9170_005709 [Blastenia crenularia]